MVEHGAEADTVVVIHQGGAFAHERDELPDPVALDPFDPLTPVTRFTQLPEGSRIGDGEATTSFGCSVRYSVQPYSSALAANPSKWLAITL